MKNLALIILLLSGFAFASEYEFNQIDQETSYHNPISVNEISKGSVYICKEIKRWKNTTADPTLSDTDWKYKVNKIGIKFVHLGRSKYIEFTDCNKSSNCRQKTAATVYYRDKLHFKSKNNLNVFGSATELIIQASGTKDKTAFDTFTEDSTLSEDLIDVLSFGLSPALENMRSLGPGKVVKETWEKNFYCIK